MPESTLNAALRQFEAIEANLVKAEKVLQAIDAAVPQGIVFGENTEHEQDCRDFQILFDTLPRINSWKPDIYIMSLEEIAQCRLDAQEFGEIEHITSIESQIAEPSKQLREYRHRFNQKRRELIRESLNDSINTIDNLLHKLSQPLKQATAPEQKIDTESLERLKQHVAQIGMLLGSSVAKPTRWPDLHRHLAFGLHGDLHDIIKHDWPNVKAGLQESMYGDNEPVPIEIEDIDTIVNRRPRGPVATRLKWNTLSDDDFERLLFSLISEEDGYENPEWLMRTNAPDRGRDLSVYRVHVDSLSGTIRQRAIIQCKHWQTKSVGVPEIATLKEQMKHWEPPRVDIHVIATSGRFTSDAVDLIEKHNQSDTALRIEMWPESHLERLLASRPALIAEFALR